MNPLSAVNSNNLTAANGNLLVSNGTNQLGRIIPLNSNSESHISSALPQNAVDSLRSSSSQVSFLAARTLNDLPNEILDQIGKYLSTAKDIHSLENSFKDMQQLEKPDYAGLRLCKFKKNILIRNHIFKTVNSRQELKKITPLCNRFAENGYKIHLELAFKPTLLQKLFHCLPNYFNTPFVKGDIPNVNQLTLNKSFNQKYFTPDSVPKSVLDITSDHNYSLDLPEDLIGRWNTCDIYYMLPVGTEGFRHANLRGTIYF